MSEGGTIRERVQRAASFFHHQEAVVLTTFNLNGSFLEEQALPIILGVEAKTAAASRAETHQRLGVTTCTVYYDPTAPPRLSGHYRFVARPVPLRGRFFHPKLVMIAGRSQEDTTWVYLAVSSANLTLSGWGRNAESFGETWIHSRRQQTWGALDGFLAMLQAYGPLEEAPAQTDGATRIRAALARMPDEEPRRGEGRLYTSETHPKGLANFLRGGGGDFEELRAYSPYWSDVAEQAAAFGARRTVLVPALRVDGASLGLARAQAEALPESVEVRRNSEDVGTRFWHMKLYRALRGQTVHTVVGSCNFTRAGLVGRGGNVEAALVFEADPHWLPDGELVDESQLATSPIPEEEVPTPAPVVIVVAYDWRSQTWRWWLEAGPGQRDFALSLPGLEPVSIGAGSQELDGPAPPRGATFRVTYEERGAICSWEGQVMELNLDHSARVYGRPLTAKEILESWSGRAPTWDLGGGQGALDGDEELDDVERDVEEDVPAAFDAVNLYDLYNSMRALRHKLKSLQGHPDAQRALLVGRPDSVMALAHLASRDGEAPVVRYLVLRELCGVLRDWAGLLEAELLQRAEEMATGARARTRALLDAELGADSSRADLMLDWFEARLAIADGGTP